jgi:hypothetical protein
MVSASILWMFQYEFKHVSWIEELPISIHSICIDSYISFEIFEPNALSNLFLTNILLLKECKYISP